MSVCGVAEILQGRSVKPLVGCVKCTTRLGWMNLIVKVNMVVDVCVCGLI